MLRRSLLAAATLIAAAALGLSAFVGRGWWTYRRLERSIVQKMDQYYLTLSSPGREEYLLESDEVFEVPYMASKLSVAAVPTRIYDLNDRLMGEFSTEKGLYVSSPEDLPPYLKKALVAAEDGTFYRHRGVNWRAVARALWTDIRRMRRVQGGSTITQQLAKMMFTTRKKTFGRKVFELFCAWRLESKFTKDQILLMYLNFAYFGHGCFGAEAASRYYFGKSVRVLELGEASMLVGIVANPSRYSPFDAPELARARQRTVLARMAKLGFIPESAAARIAEDFWRDIEERAAAPKVSFWRMTVNEAPYAVEYARRALLTRFTKERLLKGGLRIRTTFDLEAQKAAQAALQTALREENRPAEGEPPAPAPIEGALAAVRPSDGAILALVGGRRFDFQNQLFRATDSRRPMGSAVKPFVWAVAFESGGFKPEDEMTDEPVRFRLPGGRRWSPRNYGNKYYGRVTLDFALRKSLNSVAIQLLRANPIDAVLTLLAEASGAPREELPRNLSLALGTVDLSPLDMARAYAVFANGGRTVEPHFLRTVEDRDGRVILDESARPQGKAVLKPETCRLMIGVLRGVLGPEGTAYAAAQRTGFNIPAAGKTGTTNEYRDAWFAGVTPDLSAAVWMGHDDMRLPLRRGMVGGSVAAPAWMNFVKGVYRNRPTREFGQ